MLREMVQLKSKDACDNDEIKKKTLAWLDLTGEKGRRYRLVVGRIPSPDL
jgi:hypothetical protein